MKKFLMLLFLLLLPLTAFADERRNIPDTTTTEYSASQLVQSGKTYVYRIWFNPTSNGAYFTLYDVLTIGDTATTNAKAEGIEATAYNGEFLDFTDSPLVFETGLYLDIDFQKGKVLIEYR